MSNMPPPPPPLGAMPPPPPGQGWQPPPGDARAQAKAAKAYAKASRPWFAKKRTWILGVLALIVVGAIAASAGSSSDGDKKAEATSKTTSDQTGTTVKSVNAAGSHPAADDVVLKSCANDTALDIGSPTVTVTNHSSKRSTYSITITVETDGGKTQVDTAIGAAESLEPGQTTEVETIMGKSIPAGATCRVSEVLRYAS